MGKIVIYSLPLLLSLGLILVAAMGLISRATKLLAASVLVVGVLAMASSIYTVAVVETALQGISGALDALGDGLKGDEAPTDSGDSDGDGVPDGVDPYD